MNNAQHDVDIAKQNLDKATNGGNTTGSTVTDDDIKNAQNDVNDKQQALDDKKQEAADKKDSLDKADTANKNAQQNVDSTKHDLNQKENDKNTALTDKTTADKNLTDANNAYNNAVNDSDKHKQDVQNKIDNAKKDETAARNDVDNAQQNADDAQAKLDAAQKALDDAKKNQNNNVDNQQIVKDGIVGFFKSIINDKTATDAQRKDAQAALDTLLGKKNKPSWYDAQVAGNLGKGTGANSLKALQETLNYFTALNGLRAENGLNSLNVNLELIAQSIVNVYYNGGHSGAYGGSENTINGAMYAWYSEKDTYDNAIKTGSFNGQKVNSAFLEQNRHNAYNVYQKYPSLYMSTGHYLNFIDSSLSSIGFAISHSDTTYGCDCSLVLYQGLFHQPLQYLIAWQHQLE